jgi:hypothetical protein
MDIRARLTSSHPQMLVDRTGHSSQAEAGVRWAALWAFVRLDSRI